VSKRSSERWVWAGAAGLAALTGGLVAQRRFKRQIAEDPERAALSSPPRGRPFEVRSADGTSLHAEAFGAAPDDSGAAQSGEAGGRAGREPEAPTLVLAHGWTENLTYWTYQIRALTERGLRIVAYDLRGHGESEPAATGDYAIARFGEDLEAVLEACVPAGQRAMVVGHSLGAMAIAAWAKDHDVEQRAGAAALLNTGVGDLIAEQLLVPVPAVAQALNRTIAVHGFLGSRAPLPRFSTPLTAAAIRYIAFGPAATPAQVAFYERMLIASPPDVRGNIGIALSEVELYDALPRLTVPTIVVAGESDRLTPPSHARRIAEMLPQLEGLTVLPDTGHMAPLERHREVTELLAQLAATIGHDAGAVAV
jgi:pimeloyl-ACP methyl ester carboxylesterase